MKFRLLCSLIMTSQLLATGAVPMSLEEEVGQKEAASEKGANEIIFTIKTKDGQIIPIPRFVIPYSDLFEKLAEQPDQEPVPLLVTSDFLKTIIAFASVHKQYAKSPEQVQAYKALWEARDDLWTENSRKDYVSKPATINDYMHQAAFVGLKGFPLRVLLVDVAFEIGAVPRFFTEGNIEKKVRFQGIDLLDQRYTWLLENYKDELWKMYFLATGGRWEVPFVSKRAGLTERLALIFAPSAEYGFSIQELLDWDRLPQVERMSYPIELDLRGREINNLYGLKNVPRIDEVQWINLANNRLAMIKVEDFPELPNLKELFLEINRLKKLKSGAFAKLPSLRYLDLDRNDLTDVEAGAFAGLSKLERLDLLSNPNLKTLPDGIFSGLRSLKTILLYGDGLEQVSADLFTGLPLRNLDLRSNALSEQNIHELRESLSQIPHLSLEPNDEELRSLVWFFEPEEEQPQ